MLFMTDLAGKFIYQYIIWTRWRKLKENRGFPNLLISDYRSMVFDVTSHRSIMVYHVIQSTTGPSMPISLSLTWQEWLEARVAKITERNRLLSHSRSDQRVSQEIPLDSLDRYGGDLMFWYEQISGKAINIRYFMDWFIPSIILHVSFNVHPTGMLFKAICVWFPFDNVHLCFTAHFLLNLCWGDAIYTSIMRDG